MTRQEAIELLSSDVFKLCMVQLCDPLCEACYEALNMAIEALEHEQSEIIRCKNCRHDNNCEIQYCAQAGSKFFWGLTERKEE